MIDTDFRKQKDAEFLAEHELDKDQFQQLIEDKFNRARAYYEAFLKRDDLLCERD